MASNWGELFSDFKDQVRVYTEKLAITEVSFMRLITRAIQRFQRETEYLEWGVTININYQGLIYTGGDNVTPIAGTKYYVITGPVNYNGTAYIAGETFTTIGGIIITTGAGTFARYAGEFKTPTDMLRCIEVKDEDEFTLLMQDYRQYTRNQEKWIDNHLETPTDYHLRMENYHTYSTRLVSIFNNVFNIYPITREDGTEDVNLRVWYVPDMHAFSQNSTQWNTRRVGQTWFPIDTNFSTMFMNTGIHPSLAPYEWAFLAHAIASYLKSQGALSNAMVYEKEYWSEVQMAKLNKPEYTKESRRDYYCSPFS